MTKYRFSVDVSGRVADLIRELTPPGGSHAEVFRAGLAVLLAAKQRPDMTLGLARDPSALDVEITNLPIAKAAKERDDG